MLGGVLKAWHYFFPEYIRRVPITVSVYMDTCKLSVAVFLAVAFSLLVWADNHGLQDLMNDGKKKEKKDKKDEQIAELTDKVKRQLAEFENFRNRTEKEKSQMYMVGARDVIEKLLPVVDNFERGLKSIPEDQKDGPVASGMEMIYKQLITVLTDLGVTPIEAVGQEFDPNFHNAVMHAEDEELGENTVSEEFQKGYKYKDAVLRHSMVKVVN